MYVYNEAPEILFFVARPLCWSHLPKYTVEGCLGVHEKTVRVIEDEYRKRLDTYLFSLNISCHSSVNAMRGKQRVHV